MPAVVSSTVRSSGGGTSDDDGSLGCPRSTKNERNRSRISAAFTPRESSAEQPASICRLWSGFQALWVSPLWVQLTNDTPRAEETRAMDLEGLVAEARARKPQP